MAAAHGTGLGSLVFVVLIALVVPLVVRRIKVLAVPLVVGEIVIGIAVGRSGLGWVSHEHESLTFLADFGFVLLMFLSGMEVDVTLLRRTPGAPRVPLRESPLGLAVAVFAASLGIAVVLSWLLVQLGMARNTWMLALILSTTSLGVVVPVLKESGLMPTRFGQVLLLSALVADVATMLLITVLVAVLSSGLSVEVALVGVLGVAAVAVYRLGRFAERSETLRTAIADADTGQTTHLKMRAAIATLIVFVALAESIGAEVILGAFLAGVVVALLERPGEQALRHNLEALGYGFLVPLFFIHVGLAFDLAALGESPRAVLLVPLLLAAAVATKLGPAMLLRAEFGRERAIAAGVVLSARLSLIIAASTVGVRLGVITDATNAAIVLVAVITCTAAPIGFLRMVQTLAPPREVAEE